LIISYPGFSDQGIGAAAPDKASLELRVDHSGGRGVVEYSRGAGPFERNDILRGIETAEKLMASGFSEAALLLAWSASEATVRLLAEEERLVLERLNPLLTLTQATSNGVISRGDCNFLTKVMKYRNALVHGFKTIDFDPALVTELINFAKRMLQSANAPLPT
jgi:hypothetical protein